MPLPFMLPHSDRSQLPLPSPYLSRIISFLYLLRDIMRGTNVFYIKVRERDSARSRTFAQGKFHGKFRRIDHTLSEMWVEQERNSLIAHFSFFCRKVAPLSFSQAAVFVFIERLCFSRNSLWGCRCTCPAGLRSIQMLTIDPGSFLAC